MIEQLDLKRPIFKKTAAYGHFGRNDPDFTWEKTDKKELLKNEAFGETIVSKNSEVEKITTGHVNENNEDSKSVDIPPELEQTI